MTAMMKGSNLSAITGLDGSFSLDKAPPGTYYVVAQLPGYLSPLSQLSMAERMKADDATLKTVREMASTSPFLSTICIRFQAAWWQRRTVTR
jgi:hypothetical protein